MKYYLFSLLFVLAISPFLTSCETNKHISVTVVDAITKEPLDSVFVKVRAGKNGDYTKNYSEGYTDTTGKFQTDMMIGCSGGCYDIYMDYAKTGFKNKTDFNITEGTVLLSPEK